MSCAVDHFPRFSQTLIFVCIINRLHKGTFSLTWGDQFKVWLFSVSAVLHVKSHKMLKAKGKGQKEGESRESVSPGLSGRAKDTVTRRTVMILVSNHTFTPPTEILSAFSMLCQPLPAPHCISSSSTQGSGYQPRTWTNLSQSRGGSHQGSRTGIHLDVHAQM